MSNLDAEIREMLGTYVNFCLARFASSQRRDNSLRSRVSEVHIDDGFAFGQYIETTFCSRNSDPDPNTRFG